MITYEGEIDLLGRSGFAMTGATALLENCGEHGLDVKSTEASLVVKAHAKPMYSCSPEHLVFGRSSNECQITLMPGCDTSVELTGVQCSHGALQARIEGKRNVRVVLDRALWTESGPALIQLTTSCRLRPVAVVNVRVLN